MLLYWLSEGAIKNKGGVRWTIKCGFVYNKQLVQEVLEEVKKSKENWSTQ